MCSARFRLALLPLALMCIVVGTMVPIEWRAPVGWDGNSYAFDVFDNLLLFAPLGIALHRQRWWVIAGLAGILSSTAEVLQMWDVSRFSSPYDVVSNVLGALLGALFYRRLRNTEPVVTIPVNGWWLSAASLGALLLLALWQWPRPTTSLASWDDEYPLLLGSDRTQTQPWAGTIADFTLLGRALSASEVHDLERAPVGARAGYGEQVIYSDADTLRLHGAAHELPPEVARRMVSRVVASNAFTAIARITVADLEQHGPARIVSFAHDRANGNFSIGQQYDRITFGVRNAVSGTSSEGYRMETRPILRSGAAMLIVATYDGAVARVYLDGALVARNSYVAWACPVATVCDILLPLAYSLMGAFVAVLALAIWPRRHFNLASRPLVATVCITAGIMAALLLPHIAGSHEWHRNFLWLGALLVAMSVAREPLPATLPAATNRGNAEPVSRT